MGNTCSTLNSPQPGDILYKILVKTGDEPRAGTDANIKLWLSGTRGNFLTCVLDKWFHDDFEQGQIDTFKIWGTSVGELLSIQVHIGDSGLFPDWYVEFIEVEIEEQVSLFNALAQAGTAHPGSKIPKQVCKFPVYQWIFDKHWISCKEVIHHHLKDKSNYKHFDMEIYFNQCLFNWRSKPRKRDFDYDLPGYIETTDPCKLPPNLRWQIYKDKRFKNPRSVGVNFLGLSNLSGKAFSWTSYEELKKYYFSPSMKKRGLCSSTWLNWRSDDELGKLFTDTCFFKFLKDINVSDTVFSELGFDSGKKFIISDALDLSNVKCGRHKLTRTQLFGVGSSCLFEVQETKFNTNPSLISNSVHDSFDVVKIESRPKLVPVCIALNVENKLQFFKPSDAENTWLLAKLFFSNSIATKQFYKNKIFMTNFILEPFALALVRNFSHSHPVYKLLVPHLKCLMQVNNFYRKLLSERGNLSGIFSMSAGSNNYLKTCFREFKWQDLELEELDSFNVPLQSYSMLIYKSIRTLVEKIVKNFYTSDVMIIEDEELQNWILEAVTQGFDYKTGVSDDEFDFLLNTTVMIETPVVSGDIGIEKSISSGRKLIDIIAICKYSNDLLFP